MTIAPAQPGSSTSLPVPTDLVTVTIDGFEVSVPKGTLIIRAAELLGVQVPRFCDHPLLDPIGACRQCIVEIEGQRKPVTACTTTVAPDMVIKTQLTSAVAEKAQHGTMEMLLINHPLDCPICDKGGECPLQNQAMTNGATESRFRDTKRTYPKPLAISSQVLLDRERCVLCARCTRFSLQIAGDPFIELFERGALEQVAVYQDEPFESYFSGNTVQICPVGALTGASYRFRARPFDLVSTASVCEHCSAGCAQRTDHRRGRVLRRLAGDDPQVNEEWNCDKGRWAFTYATAPDRLETPLVRDDQTGQLVPASWPAALAFAARGLAQCRDRRGTAVLTGGRVTAEDAYAYAKFARIALRTNSVDMRARPHSAEEEQFLSHAVAGAGLGVTYAAVEAAPSVLLVGLEAEEECPILFLRLRKAARAHGLRLFSAAPLRSPGITKTAGTLLATVPGDEPHLLAALAAGTAPDQPLLAAAHAAVREPGAVLLVGERLAALPGALSAAVALAEATGAGLAWVPRRAGERGAVEAGALPGLLPGGRRVDQAADRAEVESVWGATVPSGAGLGLAEVLLAAEREELDGLVVGGVDPADLPDPEQALRALAAVPFLVSLEIRASAVTELADVVLPVAPVVEKAGSFLDWEGRTRSFTQVFTRVPSLPDLRVLDLVAEEMDAPIGLPDVQTARRELAALGAGATRAAAPQVTASAQPQPDVAAGQAVLATWTQLLDAGRMQDQEPHLAGTARVPRLHLSPRTAAALGALEGSEVTVRGPLGAVTLPLVVADLPDGVVWMPTNAAGAPLRAGVGAGHGDLVEIMSGTAAAALREV